MRYAESGGARASTLIDQLAIDPVATITTGNKSEHEDMYLDRKKDFQLIDDSAMYIRISCYEMPQPCTVHFKYLTPNGQMQAFASAVEL